jgi:hypothetical protein
VGKYVVQATETDWGGRTASRSFPILVSDGSPTTAEASAIRSAIRNDWCARATRTQGARKAGKCSDWVFHISNIRVSIIDPRFAAAENVKPHKKGQPASPGGTVILKRVASRWIIASTFTSLPATGCGGLSQRSGVPIPTLHDLKGC